LGYSCRCGGFFLNKSVNYDPKLKMIEQNLKLIETFCEVETKKTKIFIDDKSKEKCLKLMKKYKLRKKEFVIINPKSGRKEKDLTENEVIEQIKKNNKNKIAITGSSDENEFNKKFESFANVVNITGKTDLLTLTELVKSAKKVIAPDTGIVHIAHAVETDCEAVYKTTDKNVWGY